MPASRNASPCSSHHRPTVPSSLALGERLVGEVAGHFFGREIDVGEDHDAALGLLEHLRAPAGFAAGVEPLAAVEAHLLQRGDQMRESGAAGAIRVVVVVGPAEARARFCRSYCTRAGALRLCQYSRSAAKNRSHAQSVPKSSAAAANNCEACSKPSPRLVGTRAGVDETRRDDARPRRSAGLRLAQTRKPAYPCRSTIHSSPSACCIDRDMAKHAAARADHLLAIDGAGRPSVAGSADQRSVDRVAAQCQRRCGPPSTITGGNIPSG